MTDNDTERGHEMFHLWHFTYDVQRALAKIARQPDRPTQPLPVAETARALSLDHSDAELREQGRVPLMRGPVDEEYARTRSDLSNPVLVADVSLTPGGEPVWMLIDGTHRVRRAVIEGVTELRAYVLDRKETLAIRTDLTRRSRGVRR